MILSGGTSHPGLPLKTPPLIIILFGTDGPPPGWPTPLSTFLETCIGTFVDILSPKHLPPLSLNNTNQLLGNHVSLLYVP